MNKLVSIILTHNSEKEIANAINALKAISSRVLVVDDFSKDNTVRTAKSLNCEVVQHKFENYSRQRNWAQKYAGLNADDWVLHIDSSEIVTKKLAESIKEAVKSGGFKGYLVKKKVFFMGKQIRFGHLNPSWHLRLFKAGKGCCENRLYDQHFIVKGKAARLKGALLDIYDGSIDNWIKTHVLWSSLEAKEVLSGNMKHKVLTPVLKSDPRKRKRWLKQRVYYKLPLLFRPFLFFFYSYFLRLGFLDGRIGFIYAVLQAFWFRFLVDVKIIELRIRES